MTDWQKDVWAVLSLVVIADVLGTGLAGLVRGGPFQGVAVGGICLPSGLGAATCYDAYPLTLVVYSAFMLALTWKSGKIAIPMMLFAVSFGELAFFLSSLDPLLLVLPHAAPFFMPAYFQPVITVVWTGCVVLGLWLLKRQGVFPRRWKLWAVWGVYDAAGYFFEPYFHTTWPSMIAAEVNISLFCATMWFVFALDKPTYRKV